METLPLISGMMWKCHIYGILVNLKKVIDEGLEGDVVELGCNVGTTSIFIQKFLKQYCPNKKFYVYDSWQGLPDRHEKDGNNTKTFIKGSCKTSKDVFINNFKTLNIELPIINDGFFKDIPDDKYPNKICFAFFDGDLYTSIIDSFNKTFNKMVKGSIIIIDDIGGIPLENHELPGAENAVKEFTQKHNLKYDYEGYPSQNYKFEGKACGGAKIII